MFDSEVRRLAEISYLERGYVGTPAPTESRPVTDHSFDYSAALHFKSVEDHDFYQAKCPDHTRFVAACKPLWEHVVIYDTRRRLLDRARLCVGRRSLTDPESVAIWIVEAEFDHAVEGGFQVGNIEPAARTDGDTP